MRKRHDSTVAAQLTPHHQSTPIILLALHTADCYYNSSRADHLPVSKDVIQKKYYSVTTPENDDKNSTVQLVQDITGGSTPPTHTPDKWRLLNLFYNGMGKSWRAFLPYRALNILEYQLRNLESKSINENLQGVPHGRGSVPLHGPQPLQDMQHLERHIPTTEMTRGYHGSGCSKTQSHAEYRRLPYGTAPTTPTCGTEASIRVETLPNIISYANAFPIFPPTPTPNLIRLP